MKQISCTLKMLFLSVILVFAVSMTASAATAVTPSQVSSVKATASGKTIKLTWSKATNAKYYVVYQVNASGKVIKKVSKTSKTSLTIKKLKEGTTYHYIVRSLSKTKTYGKSSAIASATISISKPATPKNFSVSSQGSTSVSLTWSKCSGVTGYILYQYDDAKNQYVAKKTLTQKTKKATISGLTAGKTYKFVLKSYKKVNGKTLYSDASGVVTATLIKAGSDVLSVRCPRYTVTVKTATVATSSGKNISLKAGTKLTVTAKTGTKVTGYLSDGTKVTIKRSALKYTGLDSSAKNDYSKATKEKYVNYKGLKSSTNWLIWVSEYKFRVNVYKGSKGNWKLQKEFPCVSGRWSLRTASGLRKILKKIKYGQYGGPYMYFSPGKGTHSDPQGCAFHHYVDGARQSASSHGCVRMSLSALNYIYDHCPVGTTVYVH